MGGELGVRLRKNIERQIATGHPWVYRDALEPHEARPGEIVAVFDRRGRFAGRGVADAGPIAVRLYTTRDEPVDAALLGRRIRRAAELRDRVVPRDTDAYRLLHGEGDRLPGVVVDVYGSHAVLKLDGEGPAGLRDALLTALVPVLRGRSIEGLLERSGRRGPRRTELRWGTSPGNPITVREHGMAMPADLEHGQKTGLFLDHRESRRRTRDLAAGQRVLNLYGYTGGFSVAAGLGGAVQVTTVDVAGEAIRLAEQSWSANGLDPANHEPVVADVRAFAEQALRSRRAHWDMVIADPPSFAPSERALDAALGAYRALHASVLEILAPGGFYLAASCSSHVDREAFRRTIREGAQRAGRIVQVLDSWGAPPDHPRLAAFPEGDYLKVELTRVLG